MRRRIHHVQDVKGVAKLVNILQAANMRYGVFCQLPTPQKY